MRKDIFLPFLAVGGGLIGFGLRRWHLATGFEADTGLPIAGTPAAWALLIFSLALALGAALVIGRLHRIFPTDEAVFAPKGAFLPFLCLAAAGALLLLAGFGVLRPQLLGERNVIRIVQGALCVIGGGAMVALGVIYYRGVGKPNRFHLLPGYAACFWLMASYQGWSKDPVVSDYVCFLFALVFCVLAVYFIASFPFGKSPVFATCLTGTLAIYFAIVTLADAHATTDLMLLAGFLLYLVPHLALLLARDAQPAPPQADEPAPLPSTQSNDPVKEDA